MEVTNWLADHWFDVFQTVGIIGGLLFAGYTSWKDERARQISNSIAINEQYQRIWHELYERPKLARVLEKGADLKKVPVSIEEELFATTLILHLSVAFRAMRHGESVRFQGLKKDVKDFFSLPIPQAVWSKLSAFQDADFAKFIEVSSK